MNDIISPSTTVEALNKTLDAPALDPVLLAIANDYLKGMTIPEIAEEYAVSSDRITTVLDQREVKAYLDGVLATQGYLNRVKHIDLINQVINQKVQESLETGILSKKDLLDWMKHLNDVEKGIKEKPAGAAVNIQVNNYSKLMKDLLND
jgi:hypothetical protein